MPMNEKIVDGRMCDMSKHRHLRLSSLLGTVCLSVTLRVHSILTYKKIAYPLLMVGGEHTPLRTYFWQNNIT